MRNIFKQFHVLVILTILGCSKVLTPNSDFVGEWVFQTDLPLHAENTSADVEVVMSLVLNSNNTFQRKSYANNQLLQDDFGEWKEITKNELLLTFVSLGDNENVKAKLTSNTFKVAYLNYGPEKVIILTRK